MISYDFFLKCIKKDSNEIPGNLLDLENHYKHLM